MAVVTVKSASITDQDASPRVAVQSGKGAGYRAVEIDDFATVAAGDSSTSKYLLFRVPSTIRVKDLWIEWAALGGAAAADFGLYYASRKEDVGAGSVAGAVLDADFFASAVSLVAAGGPTNITNESGVYTTALRDNPLWEAAGLATDPGGKFDIVATLTADAVTGGRIYAKLGFGE